VGIGVAPPDAPARKRKKIALETAKKMLFRDALAKLERISFKGEVVARIIERNPKARERFQGYLKKISDRDSSLSTTFEHMSILLQEIRESLARALEGLFTQNEFQLRSERLKCKTFQSWANIIIANVFKVMRLQQTDDSNETFGYAQTVRRVQKVVDGHRDIVMRSYDHVRNLHAGLLEEQVEELREVGDLLDEILLRVETTLNKASPIDRTRVVECDRRLRSLSERLNQVQTRRIRDRASKTRLTILFYAIVGNAMMLSKQTLKLLEIFEESFGGRPNDEEFDLDLDRCPGAGPCGLDHARPR